MIVPELEANPDNCSFEFLTVNQNDILQELLHLSNKTSLDIIEMDNKLLPLASPLIAPVLTHIFNLSLAQGHIPKDWSLLVSLQCSRTVDLKRIPVTSDLFLLSQLLPKYLKNVLSHSFLPT